MSNKEKRVCSWAENNELMQKYHDEEWGVPVHDDRTLFEFLCLEGAQAGLSWLTVLKKRADYKKLFYNFNAKKMAEMTDEELETLREDARIIRNRLKIKAFRKNAKSFLEIKKEFKTFDAYIWSFVAQAPSNDEEERIKRNYVTSPASDNMSKDLKKRGFTFVGSTICYAFMQATGMYNDHSSFCFRRKEVSNN